MYEQWAAVKSEEGYRIKLVDNHIKVEVWGSGYQNVELSEKLLIYLLDAFRRFRMAQEGAKQLDFT